MATDIARRAYNFGQWSYQRAAEGLQTGYHWSCALASNSLVQESVQRIGIAALGLPAIYAISGVLHDSLIEISEKVDWPVSLDLTQETDLSSFYSTLAFSWILPAIGQFTTYSDRGNIIEILDQDHEIELKFTKENNWWDLDIDGIPNLSAPNVPFEVIHKLFEWLDNRFKIIKEERDAIPAEERLNFHGKATSALSGLNELLQQKLTFLDQCKATMPKGYLSKLVEKCEKISGILPKLEYEFTQNQDRVGEYESELLEIQKLKNNWLDKVEELKQTLDQPEDASLNLDLLPTLQNIGAVTGTIIVQVATQNITTEIVIPILWSILGYPPLTEELFVKAVRKIVFVTAMSGGIRATTMVTNHLVMYCFNKRPSAVENFVVSIFVAFLLGQTIVDEDA